MSKLKRGEGQRTKAKAGLARGLLFGCGLLLWFGALFLPTFAAIRGTPAALPQRFTGVERIDLGWNGIKRQEKDNTCGLAVLSLLLSWAGFEVTESQLAAQVKLTPLGISLFDWQELAKKNGVEGTWLRVAPQSLEQMPMPLVVQIKDPLGHFVLLQRVYNGHVLLADPNTGLMLFSLPEFLRVWTGRSFVIRGV